ncbi:MAG: ATP-binding protein [Candidatus Limnocylindrales bacterium]
MTTTSGAAPTASCPGPPARTRSGARVRLSLRDERGAPRRRRGGLDRARRPQPGRQRRQVLAGRRTDHRHPRGRRRRGPPACARSGDGLEADEIEQLFEPFYRGSSHHGRVPGVGLGLSVCKRIVESMGGRIWAHPRQRGGAEFGIALPSISIDTEP